MVKKSLLLLPLVYALVMACGLSAGPEPTAVPTLVVMRATVTATPLATATPILEPTALPEPTATSSPTPEPTSAPSPTPTPDGWAAGPEINYQGVQFRLDPAFGEGLYARQESGALPQVDFSYSPITDFCFQQPFCLTVYDAAAYSQLPMGGDWVIDWMNDILDGAASELPSPGGANFLIQTQIKRLAFQNGAGIRAVTMTGQAEYLAQKGSVYYEFHGLTADRRFYIALAIPVDHPLLVDPARNESGLPLFPGSQAEAEAIVRYNREMEAKLDSQPPNSFTPDLTLLDELVASLLARQ